MKTVSKLFFPVSSYLQYMKPYNQNIQYLRAEIITKMNLLLGYDLQNQNFKKSCYETFVEAVINTLKPLKSKKALDIGKKIDWQVIRQIVNPRYGYKITVPLDEKNYKTLSKICIHLGYEDWIDFTKKKQNNQTPDENDPEKQQVKRQLHEAIRIINRIYGNPAIADKNTIRKYCTIALTNEILNDIGIRRNQASEEVVTIPKLTIRVFRFNVYRPYFVELMVRETREWSEKTVNKNNVRTEYKWSISDYVYHMIKENRRWKIYARFVIDASKPLSPHFQGRKPESVFFFKRLR